MWQSRNGHGEKKRTKKWLPFPQEKTRVLFAKNYSFRITPFARWRDLEGDETMMVDVQRDIKAPNVWITAPRSLGVSCSLISGQWAPSGTDLSCCQKVMLRNYITSGCWLTITRKASFHDIVCSTIVDLADGPSSCTILCGNCFNYFLFTTYPPSAAPSASVASKSRSEKLTRY